LTQSQETFQKKIDPKHGGAVDIHKAIGKLPKPKGGWTLPGHKYTGPKKIMARGASRSVTQTY